MANPYSEAWARDVLLEVWERVTGSKPGLAELQFIQAQARLESHYGAGFDKLYPAETPTNNWGAIQCTEHKPSDGVVPGHCFMARDHKPDGTEFWWLYRKYPSPQDGAAHIVELMTVKRPKTWAAMKQGDVVTACHELYGYYTGIGTREQGEAQRVKGTMNNAAIIVKALNEPLKLWTNKEERSADKSQSGAGLGLILGTVLLGGAILLRRKGRL